MNQKGVSTFDIQIKDFVSNIIFELYLKGRFVCLFNTFSTCLRYSIKVVALSAKHFTEQKFNLLSPQMFNDVICLLIDCLVNLLHLCSDNSKYWLSYYLEKKNRKYASHKTLMFAYFFLSEIFMVHILKTREGSYQDKDL